MRAYEFLFEANLSKVTPASWLNYLKNLLISTDISIGERGDIEQDLTLTPTSKKIVQNLISELESGVSPEVIQSKIKNAVVSFNDGSIQHPIKNIFKGISIKGKETGVRSKGLVAEALLGAAMFAKLVARKGNFTDTITKDDVWDIVDQIKPSRSDTISMTVNDIDSSVSDVIKLEINLAIDIQNLLTGKEHRPLFTESVNSWVNYVNSSLAQQYADLLYKNNRPDNITVKLAGKEGGKIDVLINVLDSEGKPTRKLEQVMLSVKLADSLIGQAPRGKTAEEAFSNLEELFNPLGVNLSALKKEITDLALSSGIKDHFIDAVSLAYREAVTQLKDDSDSLLKDAKLAENISKFVDWYATHNDPNIQVIEKIPGNNFRLLNYKNLKKVFKKEKINIDVTYISGSSEKLPGKEIPRIMIHDANNNSKSGKLLEIRFRGRGTYFNHIIEPGPLLKELAAYSAFK